MSERDNKEAIPGCAAGESVFTIGQAKYSDTNNQIGGRNGYSNQNNFLL